MHPPCHPGCLTYRGLSASRGYPYYAIFDNYAPANRASVQHFIYPVSRTLGRQPDHSLHLDMVTTKATSPSTWIWAHNLWIWNPCFYIISDFEQRQKKQPWQIMYPIDITRATNASKFNSTLFKVFRHGLSQHFMLDNEKSNNKTNCIQTQHVCSFSICKHVHKTVYFQMLIFPTARSDESNLISA